VSTLADIRKAAKSDVYTWPSESTPGHFIASTVMVGQVTDYLCLGDMDDEAAPIVGRIEWPPNDSTSRPAGCLPRPRDQGRPAVDRAVGVRDRSVQGDGLVSAAERNDDSCTCNRPLGVVCAAHCIGGHCRDGEHVDRCVGPGRLTLAETYRRHGASAGVVAQVAAAERALNDVMRDL
jgi:hypothetical protein